MRFNPTHAQPRRSHVVVSTVFAGFEWWRHGGERTTNKSLRATYE